MEPVVFGAVLAAAALHAGWNAIVKMGLDRFSSVMLITFAAAVLSALALPFVGVPHVEAWPWLLVSALFHVGYNLFLIQAYRAGDFGQVYPIARGTAPLLVTSALFLFGERLTPLAMLGVALLVVGVWLMSIRGGRDLARLEGRAVAFSLATSAFIASYTVTDGFGARANGSAHGYAVWLFLLDGTLMLGVLLIARGVGGLTALRPFWRSGFAGGAMSLGAYWIVIWAMTAAPIGLVAALRESSVLFAAVLSAVLLREPPTRWRSAAAAVIVVGIAMARIG
ncbi:MAG: EamA family transporter [Geminicoccaceae bacterium]|nr:EamA family transporter [Geminicoccaceae bacterium]